MAKNTKTETEPQRDANTAYHAYQDDARRILNEIGKQLDAHRADQKSNPASWGSVGDVKAAVKDLTAIRAHLAGEFAPGEFPEFE